MNAIVMNTFIPNNTGEMTPIMTDIQFQNRHEAGVLLSKKLAVYKNSEAIVVGIPHGGVCVASAIAELLSLPMEVMPCRKIKHPSESGKNIGSVSSDDVLIHNNSYSLPQDYISHQIAMLKRSIAYENAGYYGKEKPVSFRFKTIILVDDILNSSDTMMACLKAIKKQKPIKMIVAVPIVNAEAARIVGAEVDELVFIKMEPSDETGRNYFVDFPKIDEVKVKELLKASRVRKNKRHSLKGAVL